MDISSTLFGAAAVGVFTIAFIFCKNKAKSAAESPYVSPAPNPRPRIPWHPGPLRAAPGPPLLRQRFCCDSGRAAFADCPPPRATTAALFRRRLFFLTRFLRRICACAVFLLISCS